VSAIGKSLYEMLAGEGLLEYASFIPGDLIREHLNIEMPSIGTRAQFASIALKELGAVDDVRAMLLEEGKYIAAANNGYRILSPGENAVQIDSYLSQAQNKIARARKLERTTPVMNDGRPSNLAARMLMSEKSLRRFPLQRDKPTAQNGDENNDKPYPPEGADEYDGTPA
jgi:hypothetical protein